MERDGFPQVRVQETGSSTKFSLEFLGVTVTVSTNRSNLQLFAERMLGPSVTCKACRSGDLNESPGLFLKVDLGADYDSVLTPHLRERLSRAPRLVLDQEGPSFAVLEHNPSRIVLLKEAEKDSSELIIRVERDNPHWQVLSSTNDTRSLRAIVRFIKHCIGYQLDSLGALFIHGGGVALADSGVLIVGPPGSGKSTLAFLGCLLVEGCAFLSDDTMVLRRDSKTQRITMAGWPKRAAIGFSALTAHPVLAERLRSKFSQLRRFQPNWPMAESSSWDVKGRSRVELDPDELSEIMGVQIAPVAHPKLLILPSASSLNKGVNMSQIALKDKEELLGIMDDRQRRMHIDYFGLLPQVFRHQEVLVEREQLKSELIRLPAVELRYGPGINDDFPNLWKNTLRLGGVDVPSHQD